MNRDTEIQELNIAMQQTGDRRMYERYQATRLVLEGKTRQEAAQIIGRSAHTVGKYVSAYENYGLSGLRRGMSTGRPSQLSHTQQMALRDIVANQTPQDVGFPARANWTLALVAELIKREWGETYTLRGVSRLLHALGLSYTRPTYTLEKADHEKQRIFSEETFPECKKIDE